MFGTTGWRLDVTDTYTWRVTEGVSHAYRGNNHHASCGVPHKPDDRPAMGRCPVCEMVIRIRERREQT